MIIVAHLASAIPKDENKDCGDKQHFEGGFDSVIGGDNDKGDIIENRDKGKSKRKMEGKEKEREPKQLQFSRLMERCVSFSLILSAAEKISQIHILQVF